MMEFIAAAMREPDPSIAFADAGKVCRQVLEKSSDQMNDVALALNAAADR